WYDYVAVTEVVLYSGGDGSKDVFVEVRDTAGNVAGPFSAYIERDTTPPDAPYATTATNVDGVNIEVEWASVGDADAYLIYFDHDGVSAYDGVANEGASPILVSGGVTAFTLSGLGE